jgi:6-phosphogluconolactonase
VAVEVLADVESVAAAGALRTRSAADEAIEWRGRFRIAVSGGRTPARLYQLLAADSAMRWEFVDLGFADERAVPPGHADSNFRMVTEALAAPLGARAPRIERMAGEAPDLRSAARDCEPWFQEPLDLLLLGVGEDGHVASLFPRSALLAERVRHVEAVFDSPKPPARRLTITPRVIAEARQVLVIATGRDKALAVARALASEGSAAECPARLARGGDWLLDQAAATAWRHAT